MMAYPVVVFRSMAVLYRLPSSEIINDKQKVKVSVNVKTSIKTPQSDCFVFTLEVPSYLLNNTVLI